MERGSAGDDRVLSRRNRQMEPDTGQRLDYTGRVSTARAPALPHGEPRVAAGRGDGALAVASGTGDLAFELAKRVGEAGVVVGLDLTREMLVLGRRKSLARRERRVDHQEGDAMRLPYPH